MSGDMNLDLWKRKRLLEMQKRMAAKQALQERKTPLLPKDPEESLGKIFADRAWEVWQAAKHQYPTIIIQLAKELATLIDQGQLRGPVSGEQLLGFFRTLGMNVRLETKIRVLESGELKSLAQKLKES